MIGRRRGRGFSRRATAALSTARIADYLIENTSGSEVTEPILVGLSIDNGGFTPGSQRLNTGFELGATKTDLRGDVRFGQLAGWVTVAGSGSQTLSVTPEDGAAVTPTSKTLSQLLSMVPTYDVTVSFTDTSSTVWSIGTRDILTNGSTTWTATDRYVGAALRQNTSIVKEYICSSPLFDGATPHPRLGVIFSVSFVSDDNFTTNTPRVYTQIIGHNAFYESVSANRLAYLGSLEITRGTTPSTVEAHTTRTLTGVSVSYASTIATVTADAFTVNDLGRILISADGLSVILTNYISSTQMQGNLQSGSSSPTSPTTPVLYGMRMPWATPWTTACWWPTDPSLRVRPKIQDIRNARTLLNNPVVEAPIGWPIGNNPAQMNTGLGSSKERLGIYTVDNNDGELVNNHTFFTLNDVDGSGFTTQAALDELALSDRGAFANWRNSTNTGTGLGLIISKTTGIAARLAEVSEDEFRDITIPAPQYAPIRTIDTAHLQPSWHASYLLSGEFRWAWRAYHFSVMNINEFANNFNRYNLGFAANAIFRLAACIMANMTIGAFACPRGGTTWPLMEDVDTDIGRYINTNNVGQYLADIGAGVSKTPGHMLPQWNDLQPLFTNRSGRWGWHDFASSYLSYALIMAYELGELNPTHNQIMRVLVGNSIGKQLTASYVNPQSGLAPLSPNAPATVTVARALLNMYSSLSIHAYTRGYDQNRDIPDEPARIEYPDNDQNSISAATTQTASALWTEIHNEGEDQAGGWDDTNSGYGLYPWAIIDWARSGEIDLTENVDITAQALEARNRMLSEGASRGQITLDGGGEPDWTDTASWSGSAVRRIALRGRS